MSRSSPDYTFIRGLLEIAGRRGLRTLIIKALRLWQREGLLGVLRMLKKIAYDYRYVSYSNWFRDYSALREADRAAIRRHITTFTYRPIFSILLPTSDAEPAEMRRTLNSLRAQLYPYWELCLVANTVATPQAVALLDACLEDERIRIAQVDAISDNAATAAALELATGEFIVLLNHRDALAEHALYLAAAALEHDPTLDILYSDEDRIDNAGKHGTPNFKPDWNPDLFLSRNYASGFGMFRAHLVRAVGGFRPTFSTAQEWDLALRVSAMTAAEHICHLPYVLYHRHVVAETDDSAVLAYGREAVAEHLERIGIRAEVTLAGSAGLRVRYALHEPLPLVSVIIPTRNGLQLLSHCLDSIQTRTAYAHYEIIVVDNQSDDPATLTYLGELEATGRARVLHHNAPFNYSAINNRAVQVAQGEILCLLNNDIEVIGPDWLGELVSQAARPEIGAVGAMLYYPDDTIQHAGTIVGMSGCADHPYAGAPRGTTGMMGRACLVQNLSAVTAACLVIRKEIFDAVGGFDELHLPVSFNDVDFCLRVQEHGFRNLWTPYVELYHHESASRGPEDTPAKRERARAEVAYMHKRWARFIDNDPAFNPNLSLGDKWPRQGADPRLVRPWSTA